jgi:LDH2 family malate/lactate/ureidoglycolate dehydrogenase
VDVLSGVLSGSSFLDQVHGPYDPVNRSGAGHFMMALDVAALMPAEEFNSRIDAYIESLKDVPVAPGHKQVYYPGELEMQAEKENRANGLALAADTLADLKRVAGEAGLRWEDYFGA